MRHRVIPENRQPPGLPHAFLPRAPERVLEMKPLLPSSKNSGRTKLMIEQIVALVVDDTPSIGCIVKDKSRAQHLCDLVASQIESAGIVVVRESNHALKTKGCTIEFLFGKSDKTSQPRRQSIKVWDERGTS